MFTSSLLSDRDLSIGLLVWKPSPGSYSGRLHAFKNTDVCTPTNPHYVIEHGLEEAMDQESRELESSPGCVTLSQQCNLSLLPLPRV